MRRIRHLLSIDNLSDADLLSLTEPKFAPSLAAAGLSGTLCFLFQQPSLRTMSSFASAGVQLGLTPVALTTTGDALRNQCDVGDELKQLSLTSTCIVSRTSRPLDPGLIDEMAVPLVNAGDGSNEHPSQTLVDLTVMRMFGLAGKHVLLMGNLRDHRVHHSLAKALSRLSIHVTLVSPPGLQMDACYSYGADRIIATDEKEVVDAELSRADFVYLSPTKFWNSPNEPTAPAYKLDLARARRFLRPSAKVLHPFPRHSELATDLDATPYDAYHLQTATGSAVRARLLSHLLRPGLSSALGVRRTMRAPRVHQ